MTGADVRALGTVAALVDAVAGGPLLVIGSLPPHGRDLDLAATPEDEGSLRGALADAGFVRHGDQHVRFTGGSAQVVEVSVVEDWGLAPSEVEQVRASALPLPGASRLVRPAPHHAVLLLAEQTAASGRLTRGRRERLAGALAQDPAAWDRAATAARAWRCRGALRVLRTAADGHRAGPLARVLAVAEPARSGGPLGALRGLRSGARRVAQHRLRRRRGAVVAMSGVDGAGKSTQAAALVAALEQLGEEPVVVWSRVRFDPLLARLGSMAKAALRPLRAAGSGTVPLNAEELAAVGTPERAPHRAVDAVWAQVNAVVDGYRHVRLCAPHVRKGKVVICDRYTLDSHVHLAERFADHPRAVRVAAALDVALSPRAAAAFYLDLPAEVASARKPEDVSLDRLHEHVATYRRLHDRHGAVRLDATAPSDAVAARLARAVWAARGGAPLEGSS